MATEWAEFRKKLNLTPEDEAVIALEKELIMALVQTREKAGLSQKELSKICDIKQPIIARLENAVHSPQVNTMLRVLKPMGYKLAIVPDKKPSD